MMFLLLLPVLKKVVDNIEMQKLHQIILSMKIPFVGIVEVVIARSNDETTTSINY